MSTTDPLDEFTSELTGPSASQASVMEPAAAASPLVSLEEILRRDVAINWDEAVAVVEETCTLIAPAEAGVPAPADLFIADGAVVRRQHARVQSDVTSAGRLLHSLLSTAGNTPVPLRLFVTQASAQGTYASIAAFASALAYFGKPGRRELIRALYLRCAAAAATPAAAIARPPVPKPENPPDPAQRPARRVSRLAVAALALVILPAAAVGVWSLRSRLAGDVPFSSLIAQARDVVSSLGIAPPADLPAPSPAAVAPVAVRERTAARRGTPVPVDAPRLVSHSLGAVEAARPRNRRRPSPVMASLVAAPPSADLSSRNADETAREVVALTIYSSKDADVEPPLLLYPQIPANLMLAGENRLNIMELLILETGLVDSVRLVAGPSRLPDVMLLSGAKAWRFKPASREGEPVRYRALVSWAGTP